GGLGIGLSLVRMIVDMHHGSVKAVSAGAGFGSEFIVQLPVSAESVPHDSSPATAALPGGYCRILLIEDNVDANDTLRDLLTLEGHTVMATFDGMTGLAMAKEDTYDIVICDIGLPGMDGYEVIKQLRRHTLSPAPCFIALSGYNQPKNRIRAMEVGFDHYLVKPIAIDVLLQLIASSCHGSA
ncbi:MAG TPA: hybrid sensor histidine kinase/response regulator, partial [Oxalobacteraceae bacterium]|nr:hybrid sensor histidine kinase/response regulator [Oxalobacteraceae bacterium]